MLFFFYRMGSNSTQNLGLIPFKISDHTVICERRFRCAEFGYSVRATTV